MPLSRSIRGEFDGGWVPSQCMPISLLARHGGAYFCMGAHMLHCAHRMFVALLGYMVTGQTAQLLAAQKTRPGIEVAEGHCLHVLDQYEWLQFPLSGLAVEASKCEQENLESMLEFPLGGAFYYSETLDITSAFCDAIRRPG